MTNEKLVELIDNQLQTQMVEVARTTSQNTCQFHAQTMIEETIIWNRKIVSSIYFIA